MIIHNVCDFALPEMEEEHVNTIIDVINWKAYQYEWEMRKTYAKKVKTYAKRVK